MSLLPAGSLRRTCLLLGGCCCAAAITGVWIAQFDNSISASLRAWDLPGDIEKAINLSEAYAHTSGVVMILLALLLTINADRRNSILLAVAITTVAGVTANVMKTGFVRIRPHSVDKIEVVESSQQQALDGAGVGNVEMVGADIWDARQRSFPSGHTATAWGLTIGLSLAFPRSTVVFVILAMLASLQRVTCGAHFPSDVAAGACIAFAAALVVIPLAGRYRSVSSGPAPVAGDGSGAQQR